MIAVLLATYNGERFLREQLDSLAQQTYTDFVVYVRDDGSTDSTIEILEDYSGSSPSKYRIMTDNVKHRGPKDSFMWMLENVSADYYMFCDQDDVWEPDKISLSIDKVKALESEYGKIPVMVHTDLKVVDSDLDTIHDSFWQLNDFCVDIHRSYRYACARRNVFTGCTMIFNDALKTKSVPISPNASMHDQWVGLVACRYGVVDNIPLPTVLYRQHGNNVCSAWAPEDSRRSGGLKGYYDYCRSKVPFLRDLDYGSIFKFVWYNRTYQIRKAIYKFLKK